jgi:3-hydroxy-9,10-secoandrosta-1,3,5(10)-triene-9,17-dione monooxygenase
VTTPEQLIERARELRPHLFERQAETEQRGSYSEETHALLRDAGFYRMLAPRRVGGLAVDLGTFLRVVSELARGCPASAWGVAVLAGGALRAGAVFDGPEQAELLGDGDLRCASAATPFAIATRADGGWIIDGTLSSCVGARHATHFLGRALVAASDPDVAPPPLLFIAPRSQFDVLDDSLGPLGLTGSGAQSVSFERALIAERFTRSQPSPVEGEAADAPPDPWMAGVLQAGLSAVFVGAASTAAEIYEALVRTEPTPRSPFGPRQLDPDYQRWLGATVGRVTAAELLLGEAAEQYLGAWAGADDGVPFTRAHDLRLGMLARESMKLAWSAVHDVVRTAGPGARRVAELDRIGRAMLRGWADPSNLSEELVSRQLAQERLGLPVAA